MCDMIPSLHNVHIEKNKVPLISFACIDQVAETTLGLWNSEHIVTLITQNKDVIFPLIFEALEKNVKGHWNQSVHELSAKVLQMLLEMDAELFEECQRQCSEKEAMEVKLEAQRELTWKRLEAGCTSCE